MEVGEVEQFNGGLCADRKGHGDLTSLHPFSLQESRVTQGANGSKRNAAEKSAA